MCTENENMLCLMLDGLYRQLDRLWMVCMIVTIAKSVELFRTRMFNLWHLVEHKPEDDDENPVYDFRTIRVELEAYLSGLLLLAREDECFNKTHTRTVELITTVINWIKTVED